MFECHLDSPEPGTLVKAFNGLKVYTTLNLGERKKEKSDCNLKKWELPKGSWSIQDKFCMSKLIESCLLGYKPRCGFVYWKSKSSVSQLFSLCKQPATNLLLKSCSFQSFPSFECLAAGRSLGELPWMPCAELLEGICAAAFTEELQVCAKPGPARCSLDAPSCSFKCKLLSGVCDLGGRKVVFRLSMLWRHGSL